jgi:arginine decarboxylase
VAHPDIVTECGRAMVAYQSVLVFNVLGVNEVLPKNAPQTPSGEDHKVVATLFDTYRSITRKNLIESYHDAMEAKEQATTLFALGIIDLATRGHSERLFRSCCEKILRFARELDELPEELEGLDRNLADTYYGNFSVFQSAPDSWAVKMLFPILPIHRLNERPTRLGVFADLTCDSDGKIDQFIDRRDVKHVLELHPYTGEPYFIGMFLIGRYQEILGDLHNLFGDTDAVHVRLGDGIASRSSTSSRATPSKRCWATSSTTGARARRAARRAIETALREDASPSRSPLACAGATSRG